MRRRRRNRVATALLLIATATLLATLTLLRRPAGARLYGNSALDGEEREAPSHGGFSRRLEDSRRGIRVVVGHYVGSDQEQPQPLTREQLNRNEYRPVAGDGEMGEPVQLSPVQTSKMRQYYNVNKFNLLASDRISIKRSLPDVRKKECMSKMYDIDRLPSTSVVIVFHNEAWSTLLRTVHSVISRSPRSLLKEIILVDDASDRSFLKDDLDAYAAAISSPPVHVLHLERRVGLIRARLRGAELAVGRVLTFLDAHCECTTGWLAPMLARIAEDRKRVVSPIIDVINDDTFAYVKSFEMHWGAVNWELHFRWFAVDQATMMKRRQDMTAPFKTPVMAGGLFSIDKDYFYELGAYDEEMDIWGGENLEISFRVWQCGGSLEIVPCSHVGHVFRKASPYSFPRPGGIASVLFRNLARVAEVWMDDWREFFFRLHPEAQSIRPSLNVSERVALRKRLQCNSFRWYLDNVWREHFFPMPDSFFGKVQNVKDGRCLRRPKNHSGGNQATGNAVMSNCSELLVSPLLMLFKKDGYIMSDESVCLDVPDPDMGLPSVFFLACTQSSRQRWKYEDKENFLIHEQSQLCLDLPPTPTSLSLVLTPCAATSTSQKWIFIDFDWR